LERVCFDDILSSGDIIGIQAATGQIQYLSRGWQPLDCFSQQLAALITLDSARQLGVSQDRGIVQHEDFSSEDFACCDDALPFARDILNLVWR
jgi:hypothetical protein